ncbi:gremlin-2-like [Phlebotomus papatasi]|uniref:CTCK domain-containing protein n=1 Tax=Phlebotomus papatasi TaxID=29031 RepID=A0A1B0DHZ4_PHLPP|nr:gremlin-2-like [Phlebotomus papatasi]
MNITSGGFVLLLMYCLSGSYMVNSHRLGPSESILDIINTRHIDRVLAERRQNASRDEKRFLLQNDLDDEDADTTGDFDFGHRRRPTGVLMQYNDSSPFGTPASQDIFADLQAYRADKLLKSSKNALVVTRKEYLKKDWCKTEPLVQRIREEGCLSRTIINRFCYGQCNSFYIPKSPRRPRRNRGRHQLRNGHDFEDEDLTGAAFKSCAFCKPKRFTWITVTLRCPSMTPQLRKKRIQRIKQCKCIAEPVN